ncbi:hypothetical protein GK047_14915 [Paenibacillus sp. SYP-B3998]|uniref:Uncharacterized protein n=1 Tax=Paenibacillus sp. SYP-B3998 TaxID=2678564 RepID=A0A6G3ZYK2_9BACL|nr:hypothetical protein [Paenibacillus sp. SYP-B3998]NEW07296.1 hypothetical protein [Paenibacillus sp. SYP-B3998]
MEVNLTATFHNVDNLEQAAEQLKRQGVLDIRFDNNNFIVEFQSDSFVQNLESSIASLSYGLEVCVQKSRYREAEDTITKFGGQLLT